MTERYKTNFVRGLLFAILSLAIALPALQPTNAVAAERYKTLGATTLSAAITDTSGTSWGVTSAAALRSGFATGDTYRIKVDDEIMIVTGESTNTLAVTRGAEGTSAATHSNGATVTQILTAGAFDQIKQDAKGGGAEVASTSAGALTIGGALNRVTLTSTNATMTLADGTINGQICEILIDRTSTKLATIDPAGTTTINGKTTRVLWAGESATLRWNGAEWEVRGGVWIPFTASMYKAASQTGITTEATVALDTVKFDASGLFADPTNNRFNIPRGGEYTADGNLIYSAGVSSILINGRIYGGASGTTLLRDTYTFSDATEYGLATPHKTFVAAAGDQIKLKVASVTAQAVLGGDGYSGLDLVETKPWWY